MTIYPSAFAALTTPLPDDEKRRHLGALSRDELRGVWREFEELRPAVVVICVYRGWMEAPAELKTLYPGRD